ncbi:hypothetical protein KAFR_0G01210 [Kazachstania africana CBS 2517]|uniref:Receptor L-domain domain-containing protein n=1 Tax=Kazachstania africana (strain ATCC 22294 / BCRC 22015 / CBS 2517 / CECT 1963 / NBRC 1671 / NRRL Y-8276) TaxID=1071382 RepID=H2AXQ5_KAZAF|nr:hypothetical protein KAFR_0G01210 [Kazachstania africana CBS 2517]CCF59155.1 hypothetical protein KAFR_0G01210 [Kazachstania africana CBS 2517]
MKVSTLFLLPVMANAINFPRHKFLIDNINLVRADATYVKKNIADKCSDGNHIIGTANDLRSLANDCTEVKGSIEISSSYRDSEIDFSSIKEVDGSIKISDSSSVVSVSGNHLEKVGGSFEIKNLTSLVSVSLDKLSDVQEIEWNILPLLNSLSLNKDIKNLRKISISDTALSNINVFSNIKELDILNVNNNRFLERINSNVEKINKKFSIHANSKELVLEMNDLHSVGDISIRDLSLINFPKLEYVNKSMEFIENSMKSIEIKNLKAVDGTVGIIDNDNLEKVDLNDLENIDGALMISNNTNLKSINFFKNLKQIGGAIRFEGKFSETDFPNLKLVKGSAFINSKSDSFDCGTWVATKNGRSFIRGGKIQCTSDKKESLVNLTDEGEVLDTKTSEKDDFQEDTTNKTTGSSPTTATSSKQKDKTKKTSDGLSLKPTTKVRLIICTCLILFKSLY